MNLEHSLKDVSVIIPCLNEIETISAAILSLKNELEKLSLNFEIIVMDNGSYDGSASAAKKAGAAVIFSNAVTISALRNQGAKISTGKVIVFLDADIVVEEGWGKYFLEQYKRFFKNDNFISGSHPYPRSSVNPILYAWYNAISKDVRNTHLGSGHMILSKNIFNKLEGFDETLSTGEDFDLCHRAKRQKIDITSIPQMKVTHFGYPESLFGFLKREIWHGTGDYKNFRSLFKSKVSLFALMFLMLHGLFIIAIFNDLMYQLPIFLLIIMLAISVNMYKFGIGDIKSFMYRNLVAYLYLLGRGLSFFVFFFKKIQSNKS